MTGNPSMKKFGYVLNVQLLIQLALKISGLITLAVKITDICHGGMLSF